MPLINKRVWTRTLRRGLYPINAFILSISIAEACGRKPFIGWTRFWTWQWGRRRGSVQRPAPPSPDHLRAGLVRRRAGRKRAVLGSNLEICSIFQHVYILSVNCGRNWGRFFKNFRSVITQLELRHNLFTNCEKVILRVVTELWLSYDWPKFLKNRPQFWPQFTDKM
jgi:hypothetical protein